MGPQVRLREWLAQDDSVSCEFSNFLLFSLLCLSPPLLSGLLPSFLLCEGSVSKEINRSLLVPSIHLPTLDPAFIAFIVREGSLSAWGKETGTRWEPHRFPCWQWWRGIALWGGRNNFLWARHQRWVTSGKLPGVDFRNMCELNLYCSLTFFPLPCFPGPLNWDSC